MIEIKHLRFGSAQSRLAQHHRNAPVQIPTATNWSKEVVLMTITEYVLAFLLSANGVSLFSQMRHIQEVERKLNLVLTRA